MKMTLPLIIIALILLAHCNTGGAERNLSSEILVKFKAPMSQEQIEKFTKEHQLEIVEHYKSLNNLFLCRVPEGHDASRLIQTLNEHPDVEYAEMNQEVRALEPDISIQ